MDELDHEQIHRPLAHAKQLARQLSLHCMTLRTQLDTVHDQVQATFTSLCEELQQLFHQARYLRRLRRVR